MDKAKSEMDFAAKNIRVGYFGLKVQNPLKVEAVVYDEIMISLIQNYERKIGREISLTLPFNK